MQPPFASTLPFGQGSLPQSASSYDAWSAVRLTLASPSRVPYKSVERADAAVTATLGRRETRVVSKDAAERIAWERTLLRRIRAGDRAAFGELYRAYAPALYRRVLLPKLGAPGAAEDALAETFRTAFVKLHSFEDQGVGVYPWLARIASNKAIDMHRARARTDRALTRLEALMQPEATAPRDPFAEVSARQDDAALRHKVSLVLAALHPRYRRAIELRFLEDRERAECALCLDVKLGTFDVLLLRALRSFRKEWDSQGALDQHAKVLGREGDDDQDPT